MRNCQRMETDNEREKKTERILINKQNIFLLYDNYYAKYQCIMCNIRVLYKVY